MPVCSHWLACPIDRFRLAEDRQNDQTENATREGWIRRPAWPPLCEARPRTIEPRFRSSRASVTTDFGKKRFECPDGVSKNRQFWPLIDHPKLIPAIRELLGPTARYTQHSDLHAHRGGVGWHRDSACRTFRRGARLGRVSRALPGLAGGHLPSIILREPFLARGYPGEPSPRTVGRGSRVVSLAEVDRVTGNRELEVGQAYPRRTIATGDAAAKFP